MEGKYTQQQLADMGFDILRSLKNKGLRIMDIYDILHHASIAVEHIVFGEEAVNEQGE